MYPGKAHGPICIQRRWERAVLPCVQKKRRTVNNPSGYYSYWKLAFNLMCPNSRIYPGCCLYKKHSQSVLRFPLIHCSTKTLFFNYSLVNIISSTLLNFQNLVISLWLCKRIPLFLRTRVRMSATYSEMFSNNCGCVCACMFRKSKCGRMLIIGEFRGKRIGLYYTIATFPWILIFSKIK